MGRSSFEQMTGAQVTIDYEHHMIHRGLGFTAHYESEAPVPTLVGEETAIGFLTPSLPTLIHMLIDVRADDESVFEFREDPAITLAEGTPYLPLNRFRGSLNTSAMRGNVVAPAPPNAVTTYTVAEANAGNLAIAGGTILHHETLAIAAGPPFVSVFNAQRRGQREFMLMPDTEYVAILTNLTANNTIHEIILNWYENNENDNYVIRG